MATKNVSVPIKKTTHHGKSCNLFIFSDNKLQEELLKTTQLVYIEQDGKGMVGPYHLSQSNIVLVLSLQLS